MTTEEYLISLIVRYLPTYYGNIAVGNGKSLMDFLQSESVAKPSAFISYEGWNQIDAYSNGSYTEDDDNYSIYLRTDNNVKTEARQLKTGLLAENSTFENEEGITKYVSFASGKSYRDFGSDAFEILVTIK